MASLAVIGVLAVAGAVTAPAYRRGGARSPRNAQRAGHLPQTIKTLESMRVMDNVNSLIGDQGARFQNNFVNYSLCCPSRATFLTGQYSHNHGVLDNKAPSGGFTRFEALHGDNNLAVWLQDAGYHTAMIGKTLNGYPGDVGARWVERVVRGDAERPIGLRLHAERERQLWSHYGDDPADFKQDVLTDKAVDFVDRVAPNAPPFFLWLTYTAPHAGSPQSDPNPEPALQLQRRGEAGAAPRQCVRLRAAADAPELQRGQRLRQARRGPQPPALERELGSRSIQRTYRCELESLLSVDEGVEEVVDALDAHGELDDTLIALHLRQRLPPRRAPDLQGASCESTMSPSGCRS